ncbi:MAG: hypothetical protein NC910_04105 [Candidatus Omnitrophica bacterium]|nr:hypothetical protein [Candidatus Omnitrophota bacterium]
MSDDQSAEDVFQDGEEPGFVPPEPRGGVKRILAAHTVSVLADRLAQMAALAP